jgi:thiosulfate dehydrogenase (quinone) large subunit
MMALLSLNLKANRVVEDPPFAKFLFSDSRMSAVWTVIRVLIGLSWLQSGFGKLNNPAWVETGVALQGYWTNAIQIPEQGRPRSRSIGIAPSSRGCSTAARMSGSPS